MTETEGERVCHPHNLAEQGAGDKRFGIRITARKSDPFSRLVGGEWETTHWFASAAERDAVLEDKARVHEYSRPHDEPTLDYEAVER